MSKVLDILIKATDKASNVIKNVGQNAKNTASDVANAGGKSGGFLENLALKAKELRKDQRASGENALERTLSGRGLSGAAMDSLGIGLQGMVVDKIGEAFKSVTENTGAVFKDWRDGNETLGASVNKWTQGLPLLGNFVSGFNNVINSTFRRAESKAIDENKREAERINLMTDIAKKRSDTVRGIKDGDDKEAFSLNVRLNLIGKEGLVRQIQQMKNEAELAANNAEDKKKDNLKKFDDTMNDQLKAMREKVDQAQGDDEKNKARGDYNRVLLQNLKARGELEKSEDAKIKKMIDVSLMEQQEAEGKAHQEGNKLLQNYIDQTKQIRAGSGVTLLRMNKEYLKAELEQIKDAGEQRKLELGKQAAEQMKNLAPDQQEVLRKQVLDQKKAIDADVKAQQDAAMKADNEKVQENLKNMQLKALQIQSEYGSTASEREEAKRKLEQKKLIEDAKETARQVELIMKDASATPEQKEAAKQAAIDAANASAMAYQKAVYGSQDHQNVLQGQETSHLTGLAEAAQEQDDKMNEMLSVSKEALEVQKQTLQVLQNAGILLPTGG